MKSSIARNSVALYGVQVCRKLFPLITVPFLARTLLAEGWGTVAYVFSLADLVALIIEFGFNLSATREISRLRDDREACGRVMSGVLGAQAMLACLGVSLALLVTPFIPLLQRNPQLVAAGLFYAVAQGFTPLWFFQGLERMRLAASLEVTAKSVFLVAILLVVRTPGDAWKVIALQALGSAIPAAAGIVLAARSCPLRLPSWALVHDSLRRGWAMFVFRSAESVYGAGNSFILGIFVPPAVVGYFATAEKIAKAVFGLLNPIREAIFPRLSYLAASAREEAARLARTGIAVMTAGGAALTLGLGLFGPWLIQFVAGPEFAPAVPVLRIFAAMPLVLSITYSVGLQWLLPQGRDRTVNRIIIGGGIVNIALSLLLAPQFGAIGMAVSVISSEVFVCIGMVGAVCRSTDLWPGLSTRRRGAVISMRLESKPKLDPSISYI